MNQAESTVSLQNVKMLGTEGRRGAGQQEILPNNQVYSFIEFRATDILELQVIGILPFRIQPSYRGRRRRPRRLQRHLLWHPLRRPSLWCHPPL